MTDCTWMVPTFSGGRPCALIEGHAGAHVPIRTFDDTKEPFPETANESDRCDSLNADGRRCERRRGHFDFGDISHWNSHDVPSPTRQADRAWAHRSTEKARKALSDFCRSAGNRCPACQARHMDRGETIHVFSIPVDFNRDADFILGDVIDERDALRKALVTLSGWNLPAGPPDDARAVAAMRNFAREALGGAR